MPSDAGRLQVVLADDQVVAVRGAVLYLQALDIDVIATLDDPRRLVQAFEQYAPDVVIVEVMMGGRGSALSEIGVLTTTHPEAAVLALTSDLTPVVVESALEAGCLGVVPKTCSVDALGTAVRTVARGDRHLHPKAIAAMLQRKFSQGVARPPKALSARELGVLSRVAEGMTNGEIAAELGIASDTVKTHLSRVQEKLHARDRTHAVARALRMGLFD